MGGEQGETRATWRIPHHQKPKVPIGTLREGTQMMREGARELLHSFTARGSLPYLPTLPHLTYHLGLGLMEPRREVLVWATQPVGGGRRGILREPKRVLLVCSPSVAPITRYLSEFRC